MTRRPVPLAITAVFGLLASLPASAGSVTGVTVSTPRASVNTSISVTVLGSNPCGAAHVNWGDGTAITYAITGLPSSHAHAYAQPGTYPIVARGMGNCDGEASTRVEIGGPPAVEPRSGAIAAVTFSPAPGVARQPVTIAVEGHGPCAFAVEYGDGNRQTFTGTLPRRVDHTYGTAGTYRVIVGPVAPCTGKFTETLTVVPRGGTSIRDLQIAPSPAQVRQPVTMTVLGVGTCGYTITFGDGNSEERTKPLPDTVSHVYSVADTYTIVVTATAPCSGSVRRVLTVFAGGASTL